MGDKTSIAVRVGAIRYMATEGALDGLRPEAVVWLADEWQSLRQALSDTRAAASVLESVPDGEVAESVKGLIDALTYLATAQAAELARKDAIFERLRDMARDSKTSMVSAGDVRRMATEGVSVPDPEPPIRDDGGR